MENVLGKDRYKSLRKSMSPTLLGAEGELYYQAWRAYFARKRFYFAFKSFASASGKMARSPGYRGKIQGAVFGSCDDEESKSVYFEDPRY